jgi:hypothetical protein
MAAFIACKRLIEAAAIRPAHVQIMRDRSRSWRYAFWWDCFPVLQGYQPTLNFTCGFSGLGFRNSLGLSSFASEKQEPCVPRVSTSGP